MADHQVAVQYNPGHLLNAARALMLLGAVAGVTAIMGNPDTDDATQKQVIVLGFVTWLLGVCLLSWVPVAGRFPRADALLGAAIANANAFLRHLQMIMTPWN